MPKLTAADVVCPTCSADPMRFCRTKSGFIAGTHAPRFKAASLSNTDYQARVDTFRALEAARTERHAQMMSDAGRAALQQKGKAG